MHTFDFLALIQYGMLIRKDDLTHLDNGSDIWQVFLIFRCGETITTDDSIEFSLRSPLHFGEGWDMSSKPLLDGRSLDGKMR